VAKALRPVDAELPAGVGLAATGGADAAPASPDPLVVVPLGAGSVVDVLDEQPTTRVINAKAKPLREVMPMFEHGACHADLR